MTDMYYKNVKDKTLKELPTFKVGGWLNVENPTEQEMAELATTRGLDKGLLEDALDPYEVPRIEIEDGDVYIYARYAQAKNDTITTHPILIVFAKDFIATVSRGHVDLVDNFTKEKINFCTTQKTKLLLQLLMQINTTYTRLTHQISRNVRSRGVRLDKITNQDIIQFVAFENVMDDFLASLLPTNNILQNLLSGKFLPLYENDKDLMEDLLLSNGQMIELCKSNLKSIVNIREAYTTIMTNDLNRFMKILTSITAILTIPTIVSGIYGMNVALPLQQNPAAFFIIVCGIVLLCMMLLLLFLKKKLF